MEQTLVIIKPDAFERGLVSTIMARIEAKGFKISAIKIFDPAPRDLIAEHYEQDADKPYFSLNCNFMMSGQLMVIVYKGENAILCIRNMQGNRGAPGTIRGDLCNDIRRNLLHASDSLENAAREINIWFN